MFEAQLYLFIATIRCKASKKGRDPDDNECIKNAFRIFSKILEGIVEFSSSLKVKNSRKGIRMNEKKVTRIYYEPIVLAPVMSANETSFKPDEKSVGLPDIKEGTPAIDNIS